jgi:hypothetical protein
MFFECFLASSTWRTCSKHNFLLDGLSLKEPAKNCTFSKRYTASHVLIGRPSCGVDMYGSQIDLAKRGDDSCWRFLIILGLPSSARGPSSSNEHTLSFIRLPKLFIFLALTCCAHTMSVGSVCVRTTYTSRDEWWQQRGWNAVPCL